ncbi:polyribonucleotide nucleotidyltransferase [Candidatus Peribacteria bacterium RIFCSPLOWO2_01_FULL_51_18]|nr:MAG: polyribonucleotide nucleotidyltransferase [Candidatus Peribacteria bacterium RIFCSPHIGHO2_02_FULL_51_15]OGJ66297.1 MAG: polyribonucleotide nucleotidyltransferase [Candidatus Peribacteria bacterium RIFCSPLOWO2_01_FULL_51_18]OGJ67782.1 MAG: polyribonucleotide nucleotidyltransferase [Candidatus Peribacteria bacterium RIFCSPLOWO2_02_FULL_51_10]
MQKEYSLVLGNEPLIIKTGGLATQANASVVCQMGDTVSLGNCTVSLKAREGVDFLPLQVVYQEKFYAGGKIAGSRFRKREGRPADPYVLLGRVIDRGLRPMFPKHIRNDIQVFATVLSYDFEHEHDITSANAANLAVALSDCPAGGPLGTVRVGLIGGELVLNPTVEARKKSDLDMFVTASLERVVMIEAGANQIPEPEILKAIEFGKKWAQKIARFFADIQKEIGKKKFEIEPAFEPSKEDMKMLTDWVLPIATKAITEPMAKSARRRIFTSLMDQAAEKLEAIHGSASLTAGGPAGENEDLITLYKKAPEMVDKIIKGEVRRLILEKGIRMSSRKIDEIRPITCQVDILPKRVHGSALFQRGETQGLTTCTFGAPGDRQLIEGMEGEEELRYMHHYNFPPFSVGETSNRLFVGNREIGHGSLAQRALEPALPPLESFPYTIRVVTEILESNGSSSMAATCGSTLALMAAGVPITAPVSGIALGLISDESKDKYVILSDLQDEEDFGGDMDFKVAGTAKGITAIQMDVKIKGLPDHVFAEALERSRVGRAQILETMLKEIAEPRKEMSPYAPRIETIQINPDDIRLVIGKGGETIQKITKDLGVEIDIEDSGLIFITSVNGEAMQKAKEWVLGIVEKPEVGKIYDAKVARIIDGVGAIVEFGHGKDAMIHISELQWARTEKVEDILKVGDVIQAKCVEFDALEGKTRFSLKQMTAPPAGWIPPPPRMGGPRGGGRPGGGGRGGFRR